MAEVNENKVQAAKSCFAFNPLINTLFVTDDMNCFPDRNAAVNHARGLDGKDIDVFIRDQDEAVADADQTNSATMESLTMPNLKTAQALKNGTDPGAAFTQIPATNLTGASTEPGADLAEAPAEPVAEVTPEPAAEATAEAAAPVADPAAEVTTEPAAEATAEAAAPVADPAVEVTPEPAADATAEGAAPVADENITDKITHIMDELGEVLHLKDKTDNV